MSWRWSWVGVASVLCGCGGPPPAETAPSDLAAEGTEPAAAEPGAAAEAPAAAAPATDEDVNAVLQLVIDDEELDKYLHLSEPGRFPLKIAGAGLPAKLELTKSTEPVQVVDAPKTKKEAVLVFTAIEVANGKASVRYQYDVENIRGTASLSKGAQGWELVSSRIVER